MKEYYLYPKEMKNYYYIVMGNEIRVRWILLAVVPMRQCF